MSDAAGVIMAALDPVLRGSSAVQAAFGTDKVRIYNLPPPASDISLFPYILLGVGHVINQPYECIDAGEFIAAIHVWSRSDPRSTAQAAQLASAVAATLAPLDYSSLPLDGFALVEALPLDTLYLDDPDGMTMHAVVRAAFSYDPA